jgi:hypothetical protein
MILGGWEDLDPAVQHEVKKLELEKQLAEAKLRASTIHNRVLCVVLGLITGINLIFAWGCIRHMREWHSF